MTESKFICAIEQNTLVLCERHAQAFELAAITAGTPHTILEMEDEDAMDAKCQACSLQDELTRPKIILTH
tara:strand:- start:628 stop:837 length:210 start_codon:yes stop_codon:yes gene_type:complete